jgi:signal transduction histidine kinase
MVRDFAGYEIKDLTEDICSEKALLKATEIAESTNIVSSQLLENRSHEIRTYMTRIMGMTDLTLMTELTEEQRDYLTIVKSSTGLLLKVINDILDYAKIHSEKVKLEKVPFDIRATIHEVVDLFQVAAKQKNIRLMLNIDQKIPKNPKGDFKSLKQVLSNLVGNGVRFTNHGEVTINVSLEELDVSTMQLKFIVSDTGIGIPEDTFIKLFKRFSQLNDPHMREFGGMGLTISKRLIELMDGKIYVDSKEGVGSKFSFTAVFGV